MPKIDPRYYENIEETDKLANKIVNIFKKRSICTTKPAIKSKTIVKPKSKTIVKPMPDIVKHKYKDINTFDDEEVNDGTTRQQRINDWINYINEKY